MQVELIDRDIYISNNIDNITYLEVAKALNKINGKDTELMKYVQEVGGNYTPAPIIVHINSYGGEVYQGLGIYDILKKSAAPIHTVVEGAAMSAAFLISLAGDTRYATENSTFMIHSMFDVVSGKTEELKMQLEWVEKLQKQLDNIILSSTKISQDKLNKINQEKVDWYLTTNEALNLGIIHEIW